MTKNSTFRGAEPTWANACVGNNGQPGYAEYSKGFSAAANVLLEHVLFGEGEPILDDLIYPICFSMRHSVELRLKGAIEEILKISKIKKTKLNFDLTSSHDIQNTWSFFRSESEKIDRRYVHINKNMQDTINDISNVDSTGQTFRYPADNKRKKHLTEVSLINCHVLYEKFIELEQHLNKLHQLNKYLVEEYNLGTFTKNLSRRDIFDIATKTPSRADWGNASFLTTKQDIIKEYEISSSELSKALNIIQKNHETASSINAPIDLLGLKEEQIEELIEHWTTLHPNFKARKKIRLVTSLHSREMLDEIIRDREIKKEILANLTNQITPEYVAGINALFYFARDLRFSENYESIYKYELDTAKIICNSESHRVSWRPFRLSQAAMA